MNILQLIKYLWEETLILIGIRYRAYRIILLGRYGSGRSSLLHSLKSNSFQDISHRDTLYPMIHHIIWKRQNLTIQFDIFEMSDQEVAFRLIPDYFPSSDGVIFMIDSAKTKNSDSAIDSNDFVLEKKELGILMNDSYLMNKPILVLGNKLDLESSLSENVLKSYIGLNKEEKRLRLFMCSIKKSIGVIDAMDWLHGFFTR